MGEDEELLIEDLQRRFPEVQLVHEDDEEDRHRLKLVLAFTVKVGELDIFYREAGPKAAPAILLPQGFPTSSQMFRNLIPALADRYRVVAPDYVQDDGAPVAIAWPSRA